MFNARTMLNTSLAGVAVLTGLATSGTPTIAAPTTEFAATPLQRVRVFFPRNPGQRTNLSHVEPVLRYTQNSAVANFAMQQLLTGPTIQERRQGFMTPVQLRGTSNCGGRDFTLAIASNVARVRFCREVLSAGIGDDARATSSINTTLRQFPAIRSVVILDQRGNCLGDMSGDNRCLRR